MTPDPDALAAWTRYAKQLRVALTGGLEKVLAHADDAAERAED